MPGSSASSSRARARSRSRPRSSSGSGARVVAVELGAVAEGCVAAGALRVNESDLGEREQLVGAADVLEVADACEAVTLPIPSIGAAARARRPRSAAIQPFSPSVSGRIQPKWSADRRETNSPLRTVAASRRPTSASARSPARRPCSALICLKPSMLMRTSESARSWRCARRASERSCSWKARWSGRFVS